MPTLTERTIGRDYLARVEGEGALHIRVATATVEQVELNIFEPPRFFEALLRGRPFAEAPDITARICGICPVAYQMSAVHAIEAVCGVRSTAAPRAAPAAVLRRVDREPRAPRVHAPRARLPRLRRRRRARARPPAIVERGLRLKKAGNDDGLVGGREIHPINVRVGGFYRVPTRAELRAAGRAARAGARDGARDRALGRRLRVPRLRETTSTSRSATPDEYPMSDGRIAPTVGSTSPPTSSTPLRRGARRALERAALPAARAAAPTCAARSRGSA